jgi:MFS family permease
VFTPAEILDYAWRYPFLLGGVFGVIGVYLRRWLSETPVFMAMEAQREARVELPLRTVLREHRLAMLPAMILTCVLTSAVVVFVVITPTMMQKTFGMTASPYLRPERAGHCLPQHRLRDRRAAGRPSGRLAHGHAL